MKCVRVCVRWLTSRRNQKGVPTIHGFLDICRQQQKNGRENFAANVLSPEISSRRVDNELKTSFDVELSVSEHMFCPKNIVANVANKATHLLSPTISQNFWKCAMMKCVVCRVSFKLISDHIHAKTEAHRTVCHQQQSQWKTTDEALQKYLCHFGHKSRARTHNSSPHSLRTHTQTRSHWYGRAVECGRRHWDKCQCHKRKLFFHA